MKKRVVRAKKGKPTNLSITFIRTLELISEKPISIEKLAKKRGKCLTTVASQVKMLESMQFVRRVD